MIPSRPKFKVREWLQPQPKPLICTIGLFPQTPPYSCLLRQPVHTVWWHQLFLQVSLGLVAGFGLYLIFVFEELSELEVKSSLSSSRTWSILSGGLAVTLITSEILRSLFSYIGLIGSIFMTFAISIERFLGICYPLKVTTRGCFIPAIDCSYV